MTRLGKLLLALFGLAFASVGIPEIYKWVDEGGTVHYSDTQPEQGHEMVEVEPTIPETATVEERQTAEDAARQEGEREAGLPAATAPGEPVETVKRDITDIACFTPLAAAWEGRIADSREEVSRRPLSDEEYRRLVTLLDGMVGRWWGSIEDVTCRTPKSEPPSRTDHYRVRLDAHHRIDHIFKIGASLVGTKGTRAELRQFFWLLLSRDGLRFREGRNDIVVELDQPRDDVELLRLENHELTFFWRYGGTVRRVTVVSLQQRETGFHLSEYFYVQGQLSGKRLWTLSK